MPNPFSWDYLNTVPPNTDVVDGWTIICLFVFAVGFLVSGLVFFRPGMPPLRGLFSRITIQNAAAAGTWIFGAGLFFFLVQLLQIDPFTFGRRIWMFLALITSLVFIGIVVYRYVQRSQHRTAHEAAIASGAIKRAVPQRRPVKKRRRKV
jgi:hypothetical protein